MQPLGHSSPQAARTGPWREPSSAEPSQALRTTTFKLFLFAFVDDLTLLKQQFPGGKKWSCPHCIAERWILALAVLSTTGKHISGHKSSLVPHPHALLVEGITGISSVGKDLRDHQVPPRTGHYTHPKAPCTCSVNTPGDDLR